MNSFGPEKIPAPRFSVIVPCYNERDGIEATIVRLRSVLGAAGAYELIVVNDGSTDGSGEILERVASRDPALRVIDHPGNQGYGAALKTGIRRSHAELIVITDADGTYPCERIPELVALAEQADMVVAARTGENVVYSALRRIPKLFLRKYCSWIAGRQIPDINSGLRVFRKPVFEEFFHILPDTFSFTTTITLAALTNRLDVRFVPIDFAPRVGRSKIKPIRDTLRFFHLIVRTGIYFAPLKIFSPIIAVLGVAAVGSLLYDVFLLRNLNDRTILLFLFAMNTTMFALLADMIDKRSPR